MLTTVSAEQSSKPYPPTRQFCTGQFMVRCVQKGFKAQCLPVGLPKDLKWVPFLKSNTTVMRETFRCTAQWSKYGAVLTSVCESDEKKVVKPIHKTNKWFCRI